MKDIKEFLKYYIGCECFAGTHRCKLIGINDDGAIVTHPAKGTFVILFANIKLVLRKLESMTEEEASELNDEMYGGVQDFWQSKNQLLKTFMYPWPLDDRPAFPVYVKAINWLRSKGFDCDELIKNNLAIDQSTLKQDTV